MKTLYEVDNVLVTLDEDKYVVRIYNSDVDVELTYNTLSNDVLIGQPEYVHVCFPILDYLDLIRKEGEE